MGPIVVPAPIVGRTIVGNQLKKDGLLYLANYTSPYLFEDLQFPGLQIKMTSGRLPNGIFDEPVGTTGFRVNGQATAKTPEDTTAIFDLSTP